MITADKEEIPAAPGKVYIFSLVDPMGVYDDITLGRLAEDVRELYYIEAAGVYNVLKHIPGAYAGKLIRVSYQDETGPHVDRPQQRMHQTYIYHGHLINNDYVSIQRIFLVAVKAHTGGG